MPCTPLNLFLSEFVEKFLFPIIVGIITFIVFRSLDEWKKRRSYSKLGVAVIDSLIEEVRTGVGIMNSIASPSPQRADLPKRSWNGMGTISDDILLRIIEVSDGVHPRAFQPRDIRIHCKNYFDHMTVTWDAAMADFLGWQTNAMNLINPPANFLEAANGVLTMLMQCRELLDTNSKKWFPK